MVLSHGKRKMKMGPLEKVGALGYQQLVQRLLPQWCTEYTLQRNKKYLTKYNSISYNIQVINFIATESTYVDIHIALLKPKSSKAFLFQLSSFSFRCIKTNKLRSEFIESIQTIAFFEKSFRGNAQFFILLQTHKIQPQQQHNPIKIAMMITAIAHPANCAAAVKNPKFPSHVPDSRLNWNPSSHAHVPLNSAFHGHGA